MRRFKSILRLAMDKSLGRKARTKPSGQTLTREHTPGEYQDKVARLLGDEPPTRTLQ